MTYSVVYDMREKGGSAKEGKHGETIVEVALVVDAYPTYDVKFCIVAIFGNFSNRP